MYQVFVDGKEISSCRSGQVTNGESCYAPVNAHAISVSLSPNDVRKEQRIHVSWLPGGEQPARVHFVCDEGKDASRRYGLFITGSDEVLGNWDPSKAVPLKAAEFSRGIWSATVSNLKAGKRLEYKCLRKIPGGGDRGTEWQPGENRALPSTGDGGFGGLAYSSWFGF